MKIFLFSALTVLGIYCARAQECVSCSPGTVNTGSFSTALGVDNISDSTAAFSSGGQNHSAGAYSTTLGFHNSALGTASMSAGWFNTSQSHYSVTIGKYLTAYNNTSMVIGAGAGSQSPLVNTNMNSLMVGFGSSKPTLFIGPASATDKTGRVGIGDVTSPQAKLHIKTDLGENAALRIEPWSWTAGNWAEIQFGNGSYAIRGTQSTGLGFYSPYYFVFHSGKVGIGVVSPSERLEVDGKIRSNGLKLNDGNQAEGRFLRSDASGNASWTDLPSDTTWTVAGNNIYRIPGNVGIGSATPSCRLQVAGEASFLGQNALNALQIKESSAIPVRRGISLGNDPAGDFNFYIHTWQTNPAFNFIDALDGDLLMTINGNGGVGIGTAETTGYKLAVAGAIHASEVRVEHTGQWYDSVFGGDYRLTTLEDLEKFIRLNRHLPGIPTENEVREKGIGLGAMNGLLLSKIEELTLYVIQLNASLKARQEEITRLKVLLALPPE